MPHMLYKPPCAEGRKLEGYDLHWKVFQDHEVEGAIRDGWKSLEEACKVEPEDQGEMTRTEMLECAEKLGLKVDGRWSDARLLAELGKVAK